MQRIERPTRNACKLMLRRDACGFYSVYHRDSAVVEAFIYQNGHYSRPWTLEVLRRAEVTSITKHCTLGTAFDHAMDVVEATNVHNHA